LEILFFKTKEFKEQHVYAFARIIIPFVKIFLDERFNDLPKQVREFTNESLIENSIYYEFWITHYEKDETSDKFFGLRDMWNDFIDYKTGINVTKTKRDHPEKEFKKFVKMAVGSQNIVKKKKVQCLSGYKKINNCNLIKDNDQITPFKYTITPHSIKYKQYLMRSRLEVEVAQMLDYYNILWEYETVTFHGTPSYTPDFILGNNTYIEVKPTINEALNALKTRKQIIYDNNSSATLTSITATWDSRRYINFEMYGYKIENLQLYKYNNMLSQIPANNNNQIDTIII